MNTAIDRLATSIFNKSLDECSEEELQLLTQQYPWFAPAQLLYASKLQRLDSPLYDDQVQKTSLYFQNRLWLQHLLDHHDAEAPVPSPSLAEILPVTATTEIADAAPAEPVAEAIVDTDTAGNTPLTQEDATVLEKIDIPADAGSHRVVEEDPATGDIPDADKLTMNTTRDHSKSDEPVLAIPGLKIEPIDTHAKLTFEPYHTVDYFASQGIKFKEDEKPADRFGHQLKSFTEWLKTLKRIPSAEMGKVGADPAGEKKVEQLAEHSLAERHVITEAMAEVWIKQGNRARAEEIYRKLSLLEPSKTAYFAAKIEDLKKTS